MPYVLSSCLCPLHPLWPRPDIRSCIHQASRVFLGPLISSLLSAVAGVRLSEKSGGGVLWLCSQVPLGPSRHSEF